MKKLFLSIVLSLLCLNVFAREYNSIYIPIWKNKTNVFKFQNNEFEVSLNTADWTLNPVILNKKKEIKFKLDSYAEILEIIEINDNKYVFCFSALGFEQYFIYEISSDKISEIFFDLKKNVSIRAKDLENLVFFGDTCNSDKDIMPDQTVSLYLFSTAKQKNIKIAEKKGEAFSVRILDNYKIEYKDQNGKTVQFDYSDWITVFGENFSLTGKFIPNLYSTIDVFNIADNIITYTFENTKEKKIINYSKTIIDGLLFFQLSESFPKDFSEEYYYNGIDISTDNKLLILAGVEINEKTEKKDNIILFATTKGFDKDYPFIWPMFHFEITRKYTDCTSFLKEKNKDYPVENLCKFVVDSPWVEAAKGSGIGEGFTIVNEFVYKYLLIMNGYISYEKPYLYKQNNRVKKIKVTGLKSGKSKVLDVLDTPHPQTVDISFITEAEDIRVEIADVYKGTKYADTCLHFCVTYNNKVIPYEDSIQ